MSFFSQFSEINRAQREICLWFISFIHDKWYIYNVLQDDFVSEVELFLTWGTNYPKLKHGPGQVNVTYYLWREDDFSDEY